LDLHSSVAFACVLFFVGANQNHAFWFTRRARGPRV
jgi:hypothetical protein